MDVFMFQGLGMYGSDVAANARFGNSEQIGGQVHVRTLQKQAESKSTDAVLDFNSWFVGQQ